MKNRTKYKNIIMLLAVFAGLGFASYSLSAEEVSMYLSPSTGLHIEGEQFSVDIVLDTAEENINAAEGVLTFDPEKLEVVDISTEGSILSSWTISPSHNNERGRIEFAGTTSASHRSVEGKIATVLFRTLERGTTSVRFQSGAVLAADGGGTNVLTRLISGIYTISHEIIEVVPESEYVAPRNAPRAPSITSPTHPDQDAWYTSNNVELRWSTPSDVTGARMVMNQKPYSIPSVSYPEAVSERNIKNLEDGVWYFHLQLRNHSGWGEVAHYRVQVDSVKPDNFSINEINRDDLSNPRVRFIVDAFDITSGIEKYEIQINDKNYVWTENKNQIHEIGPFEPGSYTALVKAVDRAGNYLVDTIAFEVKPLNPPVFYEYEDVLHSGSAMILKGRSYPETDVLVYLQKDKEDPKEYIVRTGDTGAFTFIPPDIPDDGIYKMQAVARDARGAMSEPSREITIAVRPPGVLMAAAYTLDTVSLFVPLLSVLFVLGLAIIYFYHRYIALRQALNKEVKEAELVVHRSFLTLKKEADRNVKLLEKTRTKRGLTREEIAVINGLKGHLSKIENSIEKEIHDIEKTLDAREYAKNLKNKASQYFNNLKKVKISKKPAK